MATKWINERAGIYSRLLAPKTGSRETRDIYIVREGGKGVTNLHEQMAVRTKGKAYAKVLRLDSGLKEPEGGQSEGRNEGRTPEEVNRG